MKRLDRYILSNIIKIFLISEFAGFLIFFVMEFFEKLENFTKSFKDLFLGMLYVLYKSPYYLNLFFPLSLLISILVFLILMIRKNEVIALRSSGINTLSFLKPMLLFSCFIACFSFILNEFFVPLSLQKSEYMYRIRIKKEEPYVFIKNDKIWFKRGSMIANIDLFDPKKDTIKGLTLIEVDKDFSIRKRIDAKDGIWDGATWRFHNVTQREFKDGEQAKRFFAEMVGLIEDPPSVFKIVKRKPEEMGFSDLKRYVKKLEDNGYDAKRYLVDLYNKISFPIINLVMVFIATAIGLRYRKTTHISFGIFAGLIVGFVFWLVHSFCLSLGYAEIFPALFSTFFSNLLFFSLGCIGILTLKR